MLPLHLLLVTHAKVADHLKHVVLDHAYYMVQFEEKHIIDSQVNSTVKEVVAVCRPLNTELQNPGWGASDRLPAIKAFPAFPLAGK